MKAREKSLYTLIHLEGFKALLGVDGWDDTICRFYLVTAPLSIEQYCKRQFLRKKYADYGDFFCGPLFRVVSPVPP